MDRPPLDADYLKALAEHVAGPDAGGLTIASELGRRALEAGYSLPELLRIHRRARMAALETHGVGVLPDCDDFLDAALDAFEITRQDYVESQRAAADAHQRANLMRGLARAYVEIATPPTLDERLAEVCIQAQQFLDAEDARLEFGRRQPTPEDPALAGLDEMSADLSGSGGCLIVRARRGRTWTELDRAILAQLAVLISAPIDDARRLDFAQRLEHIGAVIGEAVDQQAIAERLRHDGTGANDVTLRLDDAPAPESPLARLLAACAQGGRASFDHDDEGHAQAVLPLIAGGRRLGAIGLWFDEPQPFDFVQRSYLAQLADRVAAALERGRTYERERVARREAELASARYRELQELATELARAATRRRVAQVLLRRAVASSQALGGVIATFARGRRTEAIATAGSLSPGAPTGGGLLDDVLDELANLGPHATAGDLSPTLRTRLQDAGVGSFAAFPIRAGRRAIGVLGLGWAGDPVAEDIDALLQAQVAMAGPALQRAERYDVEHDIADTLQRSFLALPPVDVPGVRWSVHYRAGSAGLAGGDWYDLYALDDHRLAVVVGDVVGRGVQAAAVMGQLRSATRAMAALIDDPGDLLSALDDYVTATGHGQYSSIAFLVLDTATGELRHAVGGHPPPVLRLPDGTTHLLETGRGPLLGVACERHAATVSIEPGTLVLLYTDGLVERRTENVDAGLGRLLDAVAAAPSDPAVLCPSLAARLIPADDAVDDVAIIAVEYAP